MIVLLTLRSALPTTLKTADAVVPFEPTEVVNDPAGMVFVQVPATGLVTTTLKAHEELGGITVPCAKVTVPNPMVALAVPGLHVVEATEPELTIPEARGYTSVKVEDKVADTSACVLVIVIVSKAVPPAAILAGKKFLEITGVDGVTESLSAAEQTPLLHEVDVFVLVTLDGGEMTAVLVTWV